MSIKNATRRAAQCVLKRSAACEVITDDVGSVGKTVKLGK